MTALRRVLYIISAGTLLAGITYWVAKGPMPGDPDWDIWWLSDQLEPWIPRNSARSEAPVAQATRKHTERGRGSVPAGSRKETYAPGRGALPSIIKPHAPGQREAAPRARTPQLEGATRELGDDPSFAASMPMAAQQAEEEAANESSEPPSVIPPAISSAIESAVKEVLYEYHRATGKIPAQQDLDVPVVDFNRIEAEQVPDAMKMTITFSRPPQLPTADRFLFLCLIKVMMDNAPMIHAASVVVQIDGEDREGSIWVTRKDWDAPENELSPSQFWTIANPENTGHWWHNANDGSRQGQSDQVSPGLTG